MSSQEKRQILLVNDDGIQSPGLWAAAEALSGLGYVTVAAPRDQCSGTGRSMPSTSDGVIRALKLLVRGKDWTVYSVGGTPAQTVMHAVLEIMPRLPDLVVSGINYGENLGSGVTVSGTVGAALEGAAHGVPSLAISLETAIEYQLGYSREVDFSSAQHFTLEFARLLLEHRLPADVDVLKVDVPGSATPATPWKITRLARNRYYWPTAPVRASWEEPTQVGYTQLTDFHDVPTDSDIYAVMADQVVSVTPLSLDMTSRVDLAELERSLKKAV